jgi:hypothetical protein
MDQNQLKSQANAKQENLVSIRRALHQVPEFGLDLPKTLAIVLKEVEGLGEVTLGKDMTAAAVVIRGGQHLAQPADAPLANLMLTLLDRVGAPVEKFADSTGLIKEI